MIAAEEMSVVASTVTCLTKRLDAAAVRRWAGQLAAGVGDLSDAERVEFCVRWRS